MPAPTPCIERQCYAVAIAYGRCGEHQKEPFYFAKQSWDVKKPKDWASRNQMVLARDKYICYLCGQPGADVADHVIPLWEWAERGDPDLSPHDFSNLKAVHDRIPPHCHRTKSAYEGNRAQGNQTPPPF